jgi:hypothetical protein
MRFRRLLGKSSWPVKRGLKGSWECHALPGSMSSITNCVHSRHAGSSPRKHCDDPNGDSKRIGDQEHCGREDEGVLPYACRDRQHIIRTAGNDKVADETKEERDKHGHGDQPGRLELSGGPQQTGSEEWEYYQRDDKCDLHGGERHRNLGVGGRMPQGRDGVEEDDGDQRSA